MSETNTNANSEPKKMDPDQFAKLLEIELAQKRAQWKEAGARNRSLRVAAFFFLFLIIAGCAVAFYFMFSTVNEERANHPATPSASASVPNR